MYETISEFDSINLRIGDFIYNINNQRFEIVNKSEDSFIIRLDKLSYVCNKIVTIGELTTKYTIFQREHSTRQCNF